MERALPQLAWHLEEPRVGQCYPNYYAAKLASKFGKVVLSGTGGDELFGGYPWRYYRAVVNDDFDHYVEKYFALLAATSSEPSCYRKCSAPIWNEARARFSDARFFVAFSTNMLQRLNASGRLRKSFAVF